MSCSVSPGDARGWHVLPHSGQNRNCFLAAGRQLARKLAYLPGATSHCILQDELKGHQMISNKASHCRRFSKLYQWQVNTGAFSPGFWRRYSENSGYAKESGWACSMKTRNLA